MRSIKKSGFYSWTLGDLPNGCKFCVTGEKLVIFITGVCSTKCFYCPLSDDKWNKDFVWANEWKTKDLNTLVTEARLCGAKGAGITGGDPLIRLSRTVKAIKLLKKTFGKQFHIHLYTPLNLVSKKSLKALYDAGLDEIRFHPSFVSKNLWPRLKLACEFDWDVGIEIPGIPGYEQWIIEMIESFKAHIKFVNINELELSDTNANTLVQKGYRAKDDVSYGVGGSEKTAKEIMSYCKENTKLNVHYCTSTLKDKVQLANRLKNRAKNVAKPYDEVLADGTLQRGAIYHSSYPAISLEMKKLQRIANKKSFALKHLRSLRVELKKSFFVPSKDLELDNGKVRLLTSQKTVRKLKNFLKDKGFICAVVIEYPTFDKMIVEADIL